MITYITDYYRSRNLYDFPHFTFDVVNVQFLQIKFYNTVHKNHCRLIFLFVHVSRLYVNACTLY